MIGIVANKNKSIWYVVLDDSNDNAWKLLTPEGAQTNIRCGLLDIESSTDAQLEDAKVTDAQRMAYGKIYPESTPKAKKAPTPEFTPSSMKSKSSSHKAFGTVAPPAAGPANSQDSRGDILIVRAYERGTQWSNDWTGWKINSMQTNISCHNAIVSAMENRIPILFKDSSFYQCFAVVQQVKEIASGRWLITFEQHTEYIEGVHGEVEDAPGNPAFSYGRLKKIRQESSR